MCVDSPDILTIARYTGSGLEFLTHGGVCVVKISFVGVYERRTCCSPNQGRNR